MQTAVFSEVILVAAIIVLPMMPALLIHLANKVRG